MLSERIAGNKRILLYILLCTILLLFGCSGPSATKGSDIPVIHNNSSPSASPTPSQTANPTKTVNPSESWLWSYMEDAFQVLNDSGDRFPLCDESLKGKNQFIYDAVVGHYADIMAGITGEATKKNSKVYFTILKVEDYSAKFKELYGSTEYYDKDSYYCLAYVLALVMAEDGTVSQVFQDNPRELVVYKIDGKWIADVARG